MLLSVVLCFVGDVLRYDWNQVGWVSLNLAIYLFRYLVKVFA